LATITDDLNGYDLIVFKITGTAIIVSGDAVSPGMEISVAGIQLSNLRAARNTTESYPVSGKILFLKKLTDSTYSGGLQKHNLHAMLGYGANVTPEISNKSIEIKINGNNNYLINGSFEGSLNIYGIKIS